MLSTIRKFSTFDKIFVTYVNNFSAGRSNSEDTNHFTTVSQTNTPPVSEQSNQHSNQTTQLKRDRATVSNDHRNNTTTSSSTGTNGVVLVKLREKPQHRPTHSTSGTTRKSATGASITTAAANNNSTVSTSPTYTHHYTNNLITSDNNNDNNTSNDNHCMTDNNNHSYQSHSNHQYQHIDTAAGVDVAGQPRRKSSVPTISAMQINQTLSECEVVVTERRQRSSSATAAVGQTRASKVRKTTTANTSSGGSPSKNLGIIGVVVNAVSRSANSSPRKRTFTNDKLPSPKNVSIKTLFGESTS